MKLAVVGLGKMGMQIAHRLVDEGHEVIAHNRSNGPIEAAAGFGATPALEKDDVVKLLDGGQAIVWLMIPASVVDTELDAWLKLLPGGSIIVDGGNSDFRLTKVRAERVTAAGLELVDVGTSGGILGLENGFSMMAGGQQAAFSVIEPVLQSLSKPHGGYHYFGPSGSGHFTKMVHNSIEYGIMESYAEGYQMLKQGPYPQINLAAAAEVWQHGSIIKSDLNELTRQALNENPELKGIDGYVAESGEARWTLEIARELGIDMPAVSAAFDVRLASQAGKTTFATKLLAAMRNKFGGHAINKPEA